MTAVANNVPPPFGDQIAQMPRPEFRDRPDPQAGLIGKRWADWFRNLMNVNEKSPSRVAAVYLTSQNAAIGATDMTGGLLSAGLYRVNYEIRVVNTEVGATVQVTIDRTSGGSARSDTGALVDGGDAAGQDNDVLFFRIDGLSPVRYAVAYVGGGFLTYDLDVIVEEIQA